MIAGKVNLYTNFATHGAGKLLQLFIDMVRGQWPNVMTPRFYQYTLPKRNHSNFSPRRKKKVIRNKNYDCPLISANQSSPLQMTWENRYICMLSELSWTKLNCWIEARPVQNDNQSYTSHSPEKRFFGATFKLDKGIQCREISSMTCTQMSYDLQIPVERGSDPSPKERQRQKSFFWGRVYIVIPPNQNRPQDHKLTTTPSKPNISHQYNENAWVLMDLPHHALPAVFTSDRTSYTHYK